MSEVFFFFFFFFGGGGFNVQIVLADMKWIFFLTMIGKHCLTRMHTPSKNMNNYAIMVYDNAINKRLQTV